MRPGCGCTTAGSWDKLVEPGAGLGAALGPLTGGFLLEHFYWGSIFLVNIPICAFALAASVVVINGSGVEGMAAKTADYLKSQGVNVTAVGNMGDYNEPYQYLRLPGTTGMSHFLEHMLFKGTAAQPKGDLVRLLARYGAFWNAFTSEDVTCYFETLPKAPFATALELEADRMRNALISLEETEAERTVIVSEREGNENEPSFFLGEELQAVARTVAAVGGADFAAGRWRFGARRLGNCRGVASGVGSVDRFARATVVRRNHSLGVRDQDRRHAKGREQHGGHQRHHERHPPFIPNTCVHPHGITEPGSCCAA